MRAAKHPDVYRFKVDKEAYDALVHTSIASEVGGSISISTSLPSPAIGYMSPKDMDKLHPDLAERYKNYADAVELMHGHTLEIMLDSIPKERRDDNLYMLKRWHAISDAANFMRTKNKNDKITNIYDQAGNCILLSFDENLKYLNDTYTGL